MTLHMDISRWSILKSNRLYSLQPKTEKLYTVTKTRPGVDWGSDCEHLIAKFRLKLKNVRKRPFKYDLNQIPYDYTLEVTNRSKTSDLIDRVPEELWTEVRNIVQDVVGINLDYCDIEWFPLETNRGHSVIFEIALEYRIPDSFVDCEGYSISSKGFLPTVVDIKSSELSSPIPVLFSSLIPKMSIFTLAISCLTTSNLPRCLFQDYFIFNFLKKFCSKVQPVNNVVIVSSEQ